MADEKPFFDNAPMTSIPRTYHKMEFIAEVMEDIRKKIPVWESGIEEPTPCEKLAYDLLKDRVNSPAWAGDFQF
jgi:hypothetical protein